MVKIIHVILPPNKLMPSAFVRGLCLDGFSPSNYSFNFIHGTPKYSNNKFLRICLLLSYYLKQFNLIKSRKESCNSLLFIKPHSLFVLLLCKYFYRFKIYIDVNDPLHLPEHLGYFSKLKAILFFNLSNGIIFESLEYKEFCNKWHNTNSVIIEDTPQFDISFINFHKRDNVCVWFGSPATSRVLLDFFPHFMYISNKGFKIVLLGADPHVAKLLSLRGCNMQNIESYNHNTLLEILSSASLCFVPMPNIPSYELRGNLKTKLAMASGCITVASDLKMHRRIIKHGINGFIFSTYSDFIASIDFVSNALKFHLNTIGRSSNIEIVNNFSRKSHAEKIFKFIFDYCK